MITDSFLIGNNVNIGIVINVTDNVIDIEVTVRNQSDVRIMINGFRFRRNGYFYFTDENGIKGRVIPLSQIEYDWRVYAEDIDVIEPGEEINYSTRLNFRRINNKYHIYGDEDIIEFENPGLIRVFILYSQTNRTINEMSDIIDNAVHVPQFSRSYIIREF
ncbi:MAG: hypothetical protein LBI28_14240 [Treponema sp.]|jgi:hypothetical protein|nr:hypothetical protein [Treponema sp.]